jgi:hypothetical protein
VSGEIVEDDPMTAVSDLFDFMVEVELQKIRVRYPRASAAELRRRLDAWLLAAEPLDPNEFQQVPWPRPSQGSERPSSAASLHFKRKARRSAS